MSGFIQLFQILKRSAGLFAIVFVGVSAAFGDEVEKDEVAERMAAAKFDPSKAKVKELGEGVYQVGDVLLIKSDRSVHFSASVNMSEGPQEYFLVSAYGATHESIFRTRVKPIDLHVAMLLLGAKGGSSKPKTGFAPSSESREPFVGEITGERVEIVVSWSTDSFGRSLKGENLVLTLVDGSERVLAKSNWVFNGSEISDQSYMAQLHGNIVSLIADENSIFNYVGQGAENDDIWRANSAILPKEGDPVTISVRLIEERP